MADAMTSPAEALRSAARLLRERAEKAPPGPWRLERGHLGGMPEYVRSADDDGNVSESWREPGAAQYIAGMHPVVGLALADLLESLASCEREEDGDHYPQKLAALKVARLVLGKTETEEGAGR